MTIILLSMIPCAIIYLALRRAADSGALNAPAMSPEASRYQVAALCFFLLFAALLLAASLVDVIGKARDLSEAIGFPGLACALGSVACLLRYAAVNKAKKCDDLSEL